MSVRDSVWDRWEHELEYFGETMNDLKPAPRSGIYENVDFAEYLSWDAISNSRINLARHSLAHFKANTFKEPTPALRLGSLVHCGKLEPLSVPKRYAVMPRFEDDEANTTQNGEKPSNPRATKYYRMKASAFKSANIGKEIVTDAKYDEMVGIVTSLSRHSIAREYLESAGPVELAAVWIDPETKLICKARFDKVNHDVRRVVDLKTYTPQQGSLSPSAKFARSIATFGYHRQMAHYVNGAMELFGHDHSAALVVVESAPPYCVMAAPMHEEWLEIGQREVADTMRAIAKAFISNEWPGYESPTSWVVPAWYEAGGDDIELVVGGQSVVL